MNIRDRLTDGLDLRRLTGAEIGALDHPIVTKDQGRIIHIDRCSTETLRQHYRNDSNVDVSKIVEVDAIWGDETLRECVSAHCPLDYVIASHVIEHVPDLITWLQEMRSVLSENGQVRLAIPDRRFTFDYLRRETRLCDVLDAYLRRARAPLPLAILDFMANVITVDVADAWRGLDASQLRHIYSISQAISAARDAMENDTYHDVHCWVFTPRSFATLFAQMAEEGLHDFRCDSFHDTPQFDMQFFVSLRPSTVRSQIVASWRAMHDLARITLPKIDQRGFG